MLATSVTIAAIAVVFATRPCFRVVSLPENTRDEFIFIRANCLALHEAWRPDQSRSANSMIDSSGNAWTIAESSLLDATHLDLGELNLYQWGDEGFGIVANILPEYREELISRSSAIVGNQVGICILGRLHYVTTLTEPLSSSVVFGRFKTKDLAESYLKQIQTECMSSEPFSSPE